MKMYTFDRREDFEDFAMEIARKLELIGGYDHLVKELNDWNTTFFTTLSEFFGDLKLILIKVNAIDSLDQSLRDTITLCIPIIDKITRLR
jgi:hypothetical protein